ncbi:uncharacterized protein BT62DRAFT_537588 [Guyanagaster necrorhizus]|uniref:LIM zinc-binding domain-containing protein n=1 Tax=Guyanagaster necrorhizus TaxID=856835 RepID=A0A9P7W275_9AGAR|nr:uncharacterized protein BT62DRAFT_537588 [Guyanagaster necrorhizus MCA 3950]KAG7450822.1 hypothetical protein BT62DRAFT_537588 [Guyanagaster necrorhizus MCA 3950]
MSSRPLPRQPPSSSGFVITNQQPQQQPVLSSGQQSLTMRMAAMDIWGGPLPRPPGQYQQTGYQQAGYPQRGPVYQPQRQPFVSSRSHSFAAAHPPALRPSTISVNGQVYQAPTQPVQPYQHRSSPTPASPSLYQTYTYTQPPPPPSPVRQQSMPYPPASFSTGTVPTSSFPPSPVRQQSLPCPPAPSSSVPPSPPSPTRPVPTSSFPNGRPASVVFPVQTQVNGRRELPSPGPSQGSSPTRVLPPTSVSLHNPSSARPFPRSSSPTRPLPLVASRQSSPTKSKTFPSPMSPQRETRPQPTPSFLPPSPTRHHDTTPARPLPSTSSSGTTRPQPSPQTSSFPPSESQTTIAPLPPTRTQPSRVPPIRHPSPMRPKPTLAVDIDLDEPPPVSVAGRRGGPRTMRTSGSGGELSAGASASSKVEAPRVVLPEPSAVPKIVLPDDSSATPKIVLPGDEPRGRDPSIRGRPTPPSINVGSSPPSITIGEGPIPPQINIPGDCDNEAPSVSINAPQLANKTATISTTASKLPTVPRSRLSCADCKLPIIGRLVTASNSDRGGGLRWHPECFKCTICSELLEHVSSYERDGKMYCHLDFYETFAPKCSHCQTPIIEEHFISLDDSALGGKRTYHAQHFFCAECGDPFLSASGGLGGERSFSADTQTSEFMVYRGYAYCEACHVRLRMPKCSRCKKSIREWDEGAIEAMGRKWCRGCFRCEGCEQPFDEGTFFERDKKAWCETCFSVILRNEV